MFSECFVYLDTPPTSNLFNFTKNKRTAQKNIFTFLSADLLKRNLVLSLKLVKQLLNSNKNYELN